MSDNPPYSIRFTQAQRDFIREQASAMNMKDAQWIRHRLFSETALTPSKQKHVLLPLSQEKELAQILYLLGQSRMANNLNQIAKAVNTGTLIVDPEVYAQIDKSYRGIQWMRRTLIQALGLRP